MASSTDRIEKRVLLQAPIERVWRAISDAQEFGSWFGVHFDGPFVAGEQITGRIVPTFDLVPLARRAEAFKMNEQGWKAQLTLIERYLSQGA